MTINTTAIAKAPRRHTTSDGRGVDPSAAITTAHDRLIQAPIDVVWRIQTDVEAWPTWQPPVTACQRLDAGPLGAGSTFQWSMPISASPLSPADSLVITSTVDHVEHHRSLLWHGPAIGQHLHVEHGEHLWTFTDLDGATLVHTEETWGGAMVETDVPLATAALSASLDAWLHHLAAAAESATH